MPLSVATAPPGVVVPPVATATTATALNWVYHYGTLYGLQLVLLITLSAITIYRREISCNHCYHENDDEDNKEEEHRKEDSRRHQHSKEQRQQPQNQPQQWYDYYHWNTQQAEALLDGVGWTFSGTPLVRSVVPFVLHEWQKHVVCPTKAVTAATFWRDHGDHNDDNGKMAEEMGMWLDYAGHFFAGMPTWRKQRRRTLTCGHHSAPSWTTCPATNNNNKVVMMGPLRLPSDVWVQITSYLTAREVIQVAMVHKATYTWIHATGTTPTATLWTMLWYRDFAYTQDVTAPWNYTTQGSTPIEAVVATAETRDRQDPNSVQEGAAATTTDGINNTTTLNVRPQTINAEFYFTYAACWLDYCLAGRNTVESCLVGIEGSVYNVTDFVTEHPGSPETLLVHAGRDATAAFTTVRHSKRALRQAGTFCVARSLEHGAVVPVSSLSPDRETVGGANTPRSSSSGRRSVHQRTTHNTLHRIQQWYSLAQEAAKIRAHRRLANTRRLTDVHVYYDPFASTWNAWYTNEQLENVWVYQI